MSGIDTIVIVGAGLAAAKAAETLRTEGYDGRIVLLGDEPQPPYLRPPLSKDYLRGETGPADAFVHPVDWYAAQQVELRLGSRVTGLDARARTVGLADGERIPYDRLLVATGATPRRLDVQGTQLAGVHTLRTMADADALRVAAARARRAVVIGGGWVGSEVAASLRQLGLEVTLVMDRATPLERVLGAEVGAVYRDLHLAHGVGLVANRRVVALHGDHAVAAVTTDDGGRIAADLVVVGIGAEPRVRLASGAGLDVQDGIVVDERLATSAPGVFAAGDVAAAWHPTLGARIRVEHWDNARRQGATAARNMLGGSEAYDRLPYFYSDQFDLSMEYVGHAPTWDRVVIRGDLDERRFLAFWMREGRVVAGMSANIPKVVGAMRTLIESRSVVDAGRLADADVPLAELG